MERIDTSQAACSLEELPLSKHFKAARPICLRAMMQACAKSVWSKHSWLIWPRFVVVMTGWDCRVSRVLCYSLLTQRNFRNRSVLLPPPFPERLDINAVCMQTCYIGLAKEACRLLYHSKAQYTRPKAERQPPWQARIPKSGPSLTCKGFKRKQQTLPVSSMDPQAEETQNVEEVEPSLREETSERVFLSAVLTLVLSILGR